MGREFVVEAALAARAGDAKRGLGIFREGLEFYANMCSEFFNAVPTLDRGIIMNCLTCLVETNRKQDPDSARIEAFINEAFLGITVVVPGAGGDDEDG